MPESYGAQSHTCVTLICALQIDRQAEDRSHRLGQTRAVTVIRLVGLAELSCLPCSCILMLMMLLHACFHIASLLLSTGPALTQSACRSAETLWMKVRGLKFTV